MSWLLKSSVCLGIYKGRSLLVGLICSKVIHLQIHDKLIDAANVLVTCTHKRFRKMGISKLLMRGMTYYNNVNHIKSGIFGINEMIGHPLVCLHYFARPINTPALMKLGVVLFEPNERDNMIEYYHIGYSVDSKFVRITPEYYRQAYDIFTEYMEKYVVHNVMAYEEFVAEYCTSNIVRTSIILEDGIVRDVASYCVRPFKCTLKKGESDLPELIAAQLIMYTCLSTTSYTIYKNILADVKAANCDLMIFSNDTETDDILNDIKGVKYIDICCYPVNCNCPSITSQQISMSMLF